MKDEFTPGVYSFKSDLSGMYLKKDMDRFELPERIYGSTPSRAVKIKNTFDSRDGTTGVLLTGLKGSGKTFLMKYLANECIDDGVPVITINEPYSGNDFITFINSVGPCVIIFDEFAKVYKNHNPNGEYSDGQEALLTLFDGVASSKKLIMLSENNYWDVSSLYKNRPSRVYYSYKYEKLEKALVDEYCEANLENQDFIKPISVMSSKSLEFSFDVLQSVIEECNRYPSADFDDIVGDLNISMSESKTKLRIDKVTCIAGKYAGIEFTPNVKEVDFDNFHADLSSVSTQMIQGDNAPRTAHLSLNMNSFEEENDGKYLFVYDNYEIHCTTVEPLFSTYTSFNGTRNLDYNEMRQVRRTDSEANGPMTIGSPISASTADVPF